jgi:hypothetical protein
VSERATEVADGDAPALPHDPDIPALEEIRRRGIDDVFAEAGLGPATAVEVARHHRGFRCTLIARGAGVGAPASGGRLPADGRAGAAIIKAYAYKEDPWPLVDLLERWADGGPAAGSAPSVPPLLAFHSGLALVATGWLDGPSAEELIATGRGERAGALAAQWLRAAPSIAIDVGPLFGPRAALKDAAKSARSVEQESASLGRELWRLVRALASEPPPEKRPILGNGSFRAEHVFDLGDRPGVIDWDGFRRGAVELEGGMFLAGLSYLSATESALETEAVAAGEAFRSGLVDAVDERALSWYRAGALGRLAKFRRYEAGWPERAAALIGEAGALVAAL